MGNFKPWEINFKKMKFKIVEKTPEDYGIKNYKFRPDGTLDVFENVFINGSSLPKLPFNFGKIDGYFNCGWNNNLKSLDGAPETVNGDFSCSWNKLKSLKYTPGIINGSFWCYANKLITLEGLNLDGITGKIYVYDNPDLKLTEKEQLWATLNLGD